MKILKYNPALLKLELLASGMRLASEVKSEVGKTVKEPWRQQAGVGSSGIDLVLGKGVLAGVPVDEEFCRQSPFLLTTNNEQTVITKNGEVVQRVKIFPRPAYYGQKTSDGVLMQLIGTLRGDLLVVTLDNRCRFWGHYSGRDMLEYRGHECKYCSVGINLDTTEEYRKTTQQILEVCEGALRERMCRHVNITSGTFPPPGSGHEEYAELIATIKSKFDIWVRLTIAPPEDEHFVDLLFAAGADLVGYNYEVFDPKLYEYICPGKFWEVDGGKAHQQYDRILKHAVEKGGRNRVSSNLIAGLEPKESTVAGIEHLASMGVVPRVFIFRPLTGTQLEKHPRATVADLVYIYRKLKEITVKYGVDSGCAGCSRVEVATKDYLGINPAMPEIPDEDLVRAGIEPAEVN